MNSFRLKFSIPYIIQMNRMSMQYCNVIQSNCEHFRLKCILLNFIGSLGPIDTFWDPYHGRNTIQIRYLILLHGLVMETKVPEIYSRERQNNIVRSLNIWTCAATIDWQTLCRLIVTLDCRVQINTLKRKIMTPVFRK